MRNNKEHYLQIACVRWFRFQYPKYNKNLFAIPNGGLRNKKVAKDLKAEGVVAGVSDLFLAVPNGKYCGMFIEMKVKPNKPTPYQNEFLSNMSKSGYLINVIYSFDEFVEIVNNYFKSITIKR